MKNNSRASIRRILCTRSDRPFDTWNSATTGHQRSERGSSTASSWMRTRSYKLMQQFATGFSDEEAGLEKSAFSSSERSERLLPTDIRSFYTIEKTTKSEVKPPKARAMEFPPEEMISSSSVGKGVFTPEGLDYASRLDEGVTDEKRGAPVVSAPQNQQTTCSGPLAIPSRRRMFSRVTVYINGSTAPKISDHKLRRLLVSHGASLALSLSRRKVTHVIIGHPNDVGRGAGGGLSSTKIDKEIRRTSSAGIKYVVPEW
ncbi:hypothetical protein KEM54_002517 [Ascosphaera aggregata]|nr:hypothetical protein KEM54_002517 [Ascosphaera aggregata]